MRLNSMLATVLIFLCSLVISSCSNDELAPISLKNRETANIKTPFLLLTAAMYFRSSPRLYYWLIQQKYLGSYIRNFREHKAIPLHAKIVSVSLIWITLSYCAIWILPYIWARILFLIIAISTTWHIVSYKTLKQ